MNAKLHVTAIPKINIIKCYCPLKMESRKKRLHEGKAARHCQTQHQHEKCKWSIIEQG
jgi:hypothetical protein